MSTLRSSGGGVVVPVHHGQPVSARAVRAAITAEQPTAVLLEGGPRRAENGALGGVARAIFPQKLPLLVIGPLDVLLWGAFSARGALMRGLLAGGPPCDEMAAAAAAAASTSAAIICCDRDEVITLARASAHGGWRWRLRIGFDAFTGLVLPPACDVPVAAVARLVWLAAWRDWEGVASHARVAVLGPCWAQAAAFAATPAGRAALEWNALAEDVLRGDGRRGSSGGDADMLPDPALRDALRVAAARVISASKEGADGLGYPAALTEERDRLMGWALASTIRAEQSRFGAAAAGGQQQQQRRRPRVVAVVGAAHAPGAVRWCDEYLQREGSGGDGADASWPPRPPPDLEPLLTVPQSYVAIHVGGPIAGIAATAGSIALGFRRAPRATGAAIAAASLVVGGALSGLLGLQARWERVLAPDSLLPRGVPKE